MQNKSWHQCYGTAKITQTWLTVLPKSIMADGEADCEAGSTPSDRRETNRQTGLSKVTVSAVYLHRILWSEHTLEAGCVCERWRWEQSPGSSSTLESSWTLSSTHTKRQIKQWLRASPAAMVQLEAVKWTLSMQNRIYESSDREPITFGIALLQILPSLHCLLWLNRLWDKLWRGATGENDKTDNKYSTGKLFSKWSPDVKTSCPKKTKNSFEWHPT